MAMKILEDIAIPKEVMNYIQRLKYEKDGYKNILISTLCADFKYNMETYKNFLKLYNECNIEYELVLEEIRATYTSSYINREDIMIYFMFENNVIRIAQNSAEKGCFTCKK